MKHLFWLCPNKDKTHWVLYLHHEDVGHLCMSTAGSLEQIISNLSKIMTRYKKEESLMKKVRASEYPPVISAVEMTRLNGLYDINNNLYSHVIYDVWDTVKGDIQKALLSERPINKFLSRHRINTVTALQVNSNDNITEHDKQDVTRPMITKRLFKKVSLLT